MKRKAGRPKLGKENKAHCSIRLEPSIRDKLIKQHGSIQKWVDFVLGTTTETAEEKK